MKKVLLIAMILFFATPNMQAKDNDDSVKIVLVKEDNSDNYYYEGVVPVEGVTKEEMYKRAKDWVLANFKTGDNNSVFDEKELSIFNSPTIVLGKTKTTSGDYLNFKIKLLFKDGRYKFRFDNLIVQSNANVIGSLPPPSPYNGKGRTFMMFNDKYNRAIVEQANKALFRLTNGLDTLIKSKESTKDNW
jgi:hypothetical protein